MTLWRGTHSQLVGWWKRMGAPSAGRLLGTSSGAGRTTRFNCLAPPATRLPQCASTEVGHALSCPGVCWGEAELGGDDADMGEADSDSDAVDQWQVRSCCTQAGPSATLLSLCHRLWPGCPISSPGLHRLATESAHLRPGLSCLHTAWPPASGMIRRRQVPFC